MLILMSLTVTRTTTCNVNPPFGGAVRGSSTVQAGEFVSFECTPPSTRLIGNSRIRCLANGSLEFPIPSCTGNVSF